MGRNILGKKRVYHGLAKYPFYKSYNAMIHRCYNSYKKGRDYKYYGGRGITVCDRWLESAANFYADMGNPPFKVAQLDRIDPDGNYEPSNCRWISKEEQAKNQRRSKKHQTEYIKVKKSLLCKSCLISCRVNNAHILIKELEKDAL